MRLPARRSRAFTLIELIVVIVILGILVAVAAFTYNAVVDHSRQTQVDRLADQVGMSVQGYSATKRVPYTAANFPQSVIDDIVAGDLAPGATVDAMTAGTGDDAGYGLVHVSRDGHEAWVKFHLDETGTGPVKPGHPNPGGGGSTPGPTPDPTPTPEVGVSIVDFVAADTLTGVSGALIPSNYAGNNQVVEAVTLGGNIYVLDTGGRFLRVDPGTSSSTLLGKLPGSGSSNDQVVTDGTYLYVSDAMAGAIYKYDPANIAAGPVWSYAVPGNVESLGIDGAGNPTFVFKFPFTQRFLDKDTGTVLRDGSELMNGTHQVYVRGVDRIWGIEYDSGLYENNPSGNAISVRVDNEYSYGNNSTWSAITTVGDDYVYSTDGAGACIIRYQAATRAKQVVAGTCAQSGPLTAGTGAGIQFPHISALTYANGHLWVFTPDGLLKLAP